MDNPQVIYLATHGFAARMILQTRLVHRLSERGVRVAIMVPDARDASLQAAVAGTGVTLIEQSGEVSAFEAQVMQFRRYLLDDIEDNPCLLEKHMQRAEDPNRSGLRGLQTWLGWQTYRLVKRIPAIRRWYQKLEPRLLASSEITDLLKRLQPELVVATYPVFAPEYQMLASARKLGIKTVIHLLSWDNITAKGAFPALADRYIAWGDIMAEELMEKYEVPAAHIFRCGVPHFDLHRQIAADDEPNKPLLELGLDSAKPYLLFTMSAPRFGPREIDIVEWVAGQVAAGTFGPDMQLVVRPHPQNMVGHMADFSWGARLKVIEELERVAVNYPDLVQDSKLPWSMDQQDMVSFSRLIKGSTVVLNSGSTVSIDALMHHKPVILTSFDGAESLPYWQSARRLIDFTHLKKLVSSGGITVARSYADLREAVMSYYDEPDRNLADRMHILQRQCYLADGKATERVIDVLEELVNADSLTPH